VSERSATSRKRANERTNEPGHATENLELPGTDTVLAHEALAAVHLPFATMMAAQRDGDRRERPPLWHRVHDTLQTQIERTAAEMLARERNGGMRLFHQLRHTREIQVSEIDVQSLIVRYRIH